MSDLPATIGTPVTVEIAGKRWTFSPLTLDDEAAMEIELRLLLGEKLAVVDQVRSMCGGLDARDRVELLKWAVQEEFRLRRLGPIELAAEFRIPNVERIVLRHQLRRHHPDVTDAEVGRLTSDYAAKKLVALMVDQMRAIVPKDSGPALATLLAMAGQATTPAPAAGPSLCDTSPSGTAGP